MTDFHYVPAVCMASYQALWRGKECYLQPWEIREKDTWSSERMRGRESGIFEFIYRGLPSAFCAPLLWLAQRLKRLPPMRETRVQSLGQEDPLEKEMTIHSSILAWRIPWMEKPSRLQSTGLQRVGHDWAISSSPSPYSGSQLLKLSIVITGDQTVLCCGSCPVHCRMVSSTPVL